jgi:hypothetical protein
MAAAEHLFGDSRISSTELAASNALMQLIVS